MRTIDTAETSVQITEAKVDKICQECGRRKSLADFYSKGSGRHESRCKPCSLKKKAKRRKERAGQRDVTVIAVGHPDRRHIGSKLGEVIVSVMKASEGSEV